MNGTTFAITGADGTKDSDARRQRVVIWTEMMFVMRRTKQRVRKSVDSNFGYCFCRLPTRHALVAE